MIFSIDFYSTNYNSFILKCFIQFACTSLDTFQKEGGAGGRGGDNFLNLLQKEGSTQKAGGRFPQKRGGSNPGGNCGPDNKIMIEMFVNIYMRQV